MVHPLALDPDLRRHGVQTTIKPIFRILGLHGAAELLAGQPHGIFVASLVVIAIASTLVAVGMKTYAKFQKWAMWIGLAGVLVCGILLLVTSGDSFKEKFNEASEKYYGGDAGLLDLTKYQQDEAGLFVYDDEGNMVVAEGETHAGLFEAIEAIGEGTGMPTSTFQGGIGKYTWFLIPFALFWMAWPNWGATLYGEVRGAKDFRKNIYQMLGGVFMGTMAGSGRRISPIGQGLRLAHGDDLLDRAQRGLRGHPHRRHLAAALRLVRHPLPVVDAHDLRGGLRPDPA